MFDKKFTKQLGDCLKLDNMLGFYLNEGLTEYDRIFSINSQDDNSIWCDFYFFQMNRKDFLLILEEEKLIYIKQTDDNTVKRFSLLYDILKKNLGGDLELINY